MKSSFALSAVALLGLIWLAGCGSAEPTLLPPDPKRSDELVIESVELLQLESWPVQFRMELTGTLPSACHSLDYAVILPDADGVIEVQAQAILETNSDCSQQAQSFRQGIGLGSYTEGDFQVLLNGKPAGEIQLGGGSDAQGSDDVGGGDDARTRLHRRDGALDPRKFSGPDRNLSSRGSAHPVRIVGIHCRSSG